MSATATVPRPRQLRVVPWSRLADETLAGRAASGNDAAFTALYERYYGPLLGYTRSILRDAEDAHDATQNALESALRALPHRDSGRPLRPWLYKIAHNEAITIMRRRRPQTELQAAFEPTVPGPEVDAEQRGRLEQLVDDLQSLPERQRGALVMRELNGLSYDDIGSALGLTNEAARRAVFDARNALHDAAAGRDTACVSVRHSISDGDRRSLRARGIRAHLRSCDDCASFQRSIGARRADLHLLAPWVSGAALMGALGLGGGGGGALLAAGGGTTAAGGGAAGWASLPMAIKGLAVAAAVATTGTAAVEIQHVAKPDRRTTSPQAAKQPDQATARALRAATRAAAASRRAATASAAAIRTGNRVRATHAGVRSSAPSRATATRATTPALLAPAPTVRRELAPVAAKPQPTAPAHAPLTPTKPSETPLERLERLRKQVQQAYADAQAVAADGSADALALATGLLDQTLAPLRKSIQRVLATLGMSLPTAAPAPAPAASSTTVQTVLAPVRQVLDGVQALLARLLGQR
ncbi:MAG TPA: sigma-70 family RNA polymerase sigma factor [Solirubrobacteraceae bacterium]|jgi:RNA polymerase sigma factor (sigma-70 family)|nr:sigma-70 family RNA polymerase sigma factor [Solirubrobacteraceae bacterium]